jgi:hypothetical protein
MKSIGGPSDATNPVREFLLGAGILQQIVRRGS